MRRGGNLPTRARSFSDGRTAGVGFTLIVPYGEHGSSRAERADVFDRHRIIVIELFHSPRLMDHGRGCAHALFARHRFNRRYRRFMLAVSRNRIAACCLLMAVGGWTCPAWTEAAWAQDDETTADTIPSQSFMTRSTLTGDWSGVRNDLLDAGILFGATYTNDILGNVSGGIHRGAIYEGRLELDADLDLEKIFGWRGAVFHASAFQIHGRGLSTRNLDNIMTVSSIEADPSTRLFTLWLEKTLFDEHLSLRLGQLAADDEFITSNTASLFLNGTFGWPALAGANLPSGGPAYPLAAPGARVSVAPLENLTVLAAVFSGDPAGPGTGDPQLRDGSGTRFSTGGGTFLIGETQYTINGGAGATGLPGTYKFGAWYHSGSFADQRLDTLGVSLASPTSSGVARMHRGNYGLYMIADQMIWREEGTDDHGLSLFFRIGGAPSDRNLLSFYADAGVAYKGLIPSRVDDILGLGFAYAGVSDAASSLDRDALVLSGSGVVRDHEAVIELNYQAQVAPWWSVQPDLQYVFHPGGRIANPLVTAGATIRGAALIGIRSTIKF
jgi:porin